MPDDSLLAVRPCGHAAALVRPDCSEAAGFRARWIGESCTLLTLPTDEAIARLIAEGSLHRGCKARALAQQLTLFADGLEGAA